MDKPLALVTAPFRGPGLDRLRDLCSEVVIDPWIDHQPLRLYNSEQLAERIAAEGAELLVVESDSVKGPVLDLPLRAIGSCRGDPNNVDIPANSFAKIVARSVATDRYVELQPYTSGAKMQAMTET